MIRNPTRLLETLTEEEAKQCFRLAFPVWHAPDISVNLWERSAPSIVIQDQYFRLQLADTTFYMMDKRGQGDEEQLGIEFNSTPLTDYLDEIGIDTRGLIESGKAIEKSVA